MSDSGGPDRPAQGRGRGPLAYQPRLLETDALMARFVGRTGLLSQVIDDLEAIGFDDGPQHHLIVGASGTGKTALLLRIQAAVEDHPTLCKRWVALTFPERQYNVGRLSDFWCNCLAALSESFARGGDDHSAAAVDRLRRSLPPSPEERRCRQALRVLRQSAAAVRKRPLLLLDNIDMVFERLRDDQWGLREALSDEQGPMVIGTSARAIEATYRYDQPFYDFFALHELSGLPLEQAEQLIVGYAADAGRDDVAQIIRSNPARFRVVHWLLQGNVRAMVLFYAVLAAGESTGPMGDLAQILDYNTPAYDARVGHLSPQAQRVLDGMARHWDPMSAGELADRLHLEVNAVSSQLSRLVRQGIVQKVPYHPAAKTGFQVADRVFNLWYLLRSPSEARRRVARLVNLRMRLEQLGEPDVDRRSVLKELVGGLPEAWVECLAIEQRLALDETTARRLAPAIRDTLGLLAAAH